LRQSWCFSALSAIRFAPTPTEALGDRGLSLRQGTIVDATLINAPSSTKNKDGKRDPEMHQTKKGNQYCVSRTQVR